MAYHDQTSPTKSDLTSATLWDRNWKGSARGSWNLSEYLRRMKSRPLLKLLARQLGEYVDGPAEVLEVGCAPGSILAELHQMRGHDHLHGLDISQVGLRATRARFDELRIDANLHNVDLRSFYPSSRYDFVYSCGLIEHFRDPLSILKHHARICQPGGRVLVSVPNYTGRWQTRLIAQLNPDLLRTHNLQVMSLGVLRELMVATGLEDIQTGACGMGKFCTSCSVKTPRNKALRIAAKTWNVLRRVLPLTPNWHTTYWAAGSVPGVALRKAG